MPASFVIGLFCDDVRDEVSGAHTIVGVYPDNIALPQVSVMLPKLTLYVRSLLDPASEPGAINVALIFPNGESKNVLEIDPATTKKACDDARAAGTPYAGIISKVVMLNFTVVQAGRVVAVAKIEGRDQVCAALNFTVDSTSSTAPEQPSPQSGDAERP
jgi:hypothetical protein